MNRGKVTKEERRSAANIRQEERNNRSDKKQLVLIEERRGESGREKQRLLDRIGKSPNKQTVKTMEKTDKNEDLHEANNVQDLSNQLDDRTPEKYKKGKNVRRK